MQIQVSQNSCYSCILKQSIAFFLFVYDVKPSQANNRNWGKHILAGADILRAREGGDQKDRQIKMKLGEVANVVKTGSKQMNRWGNYMEREKAGRRRRHARIQL